MMFSHIKEVIMAFKPEIKVGDTVKLKGCYYSPEMVVEYINDTVSPIAVAVEVIWFSIHNGLQRESLPITLLVKVKAPKL